MGLLVPVPTLGLAFKLVQMLVLEVARLWVLGRVYTLALLNIIFSTNLFTSHTMFRVTLTRPHCTRNST